MIESGEQQATVNGVQMWAPLYAYDLGEETLVFFLFIEALIG
jgi:hypothetical protein